MVRNNTGVYISKITDTYILLPGLKKSLCVKSYLLTIVQLKQLI